MQLPGFKAKGESATCGRSGLEVKTYRNDAGAATT
jgi:hypothetical protein